MDAPIRGHTEVLSCGACVLFRRQGIRPSDCGIGHTGTEFGVGRDAGRGIALGGDTGLRMARQRNLGCLGLWLVLVACV